MSGAMENYKTAQELQDDLLALKLRLAFQEELEEEIERISREQIPEPELQAAINRADSGMIRLIRQNVRKKRMTQTVRVILPRFGRALAAGLLVFFIGLSTAVAAVPSVRANMLHFIMKIDEKYTSLEFVNSGIEIEVPTEWRGRYYLSYIPDGFVFEEADGFEVTYADSLGNMLMFAEYGAESSIDIDTEDANVQFVDLQGHSALLSEKNGWVTLTWAVSNRYFILDLQGTAEEAIYIARSVILID